MNMLELLTQDHRYLDELFVRVETTNDREELAFLRDRISDELSLHAEVEEDIFYPAARDAGGRELNELVLQAIEEHHAVDVALDELDRMRVRDVRFKPKLMVLIKSVRQHVRLEEDELFPKAAEAFAPERLDEMAEAAERVQRTADTRLSSRARRYSRRYGVAAAPVAILEVASDICCALCAPRRFETARR